MKYTRWMVPLLLSGAGVWWSLRGLSGSDFLSSLSHIHTPMVLLAVPLVGLLELGLRAERWRLLLGAGPTDRPLLFKTVAGSYFLNNVLPFRAGEAARVYWTQRHTGRPVTTCIAALVVDRGCDIFTVASFVVFLSWSGEKTFISTTAARGAGTLLAAGLLGAGLWIRFSTAVRVWVERSSLPEGLRRGARVLLDGTAALQSFSSLAGVGGLSLVVWGGNVFLIKIIAGLFGLELGSAQSAAFLVALSLGVALPSTPGYIGTYEAAGVSALLAFGFPRAQSAPFVLVFHALQIISTMVWGIPSLWGLGKRPPEPLSANVLKSPS